jgi:hypothetical protein
MMLQYSGLTLVIGSWIGGYYIVRRWYDKSLPTISRHAASNKTASRIFASILIGFGLVFYYWLNRWFVPYLDLGVYFQGILGFTVLCQILVGLAPDTTGWSRTIHRWAAYTMGVLYLPLSVLIIASHQLTAIARIICVLLALYMLVTFSLVAVARKAQDKYLFFQASYLVAFQVLILSAAYL